VFCSDRNRYYDKLELADSGEDKAILSWAYYVLSGLKEEISKIDKLRDYKYLKENILDKALKYAFDRKLINKKEKEVLIIAIEKKEFQARDIKHLFDEGVAHTEVSRFLRKMRENKLIIPIEEKSRKYVINISNGYLLRGIMRAFDENNFLPLKGEVE
jgi:Fic family protein